MGAWKSCNVCHFYPRSPCGERHCIIDIINNVVDNFYPRSPCGERRQVKQTYREIISISIHALLAESDPGKVREVEPGLAFLSTLSLRRATGGFAAGSWRLAIFLSTLSLRRATNEDRYGQQFWRISIHALLAESDENALS